MVSQPRLQTFVRYQVTEGGLGLSVIILPPSSSDDVTFDYAPRTTGNEAHGFRVPVRD